MSAPGFAATAEQLAQALERAESAERISQFAQSIAAQLSLPALVEIAVARTRELCAAEGASLLLVDAQTGALYFDTVKGAGVGLLERSGVGAGIAHRVARETRPILVEDAQASADFDGSFDLRTGFVTGSVIAVPLLMGGDVLGVLEAVRSTSAAPFQQADLKRLTELAPHVAIAVHNAQITAELLTTQTAMLQANVTLERKVQQRTEQISRGKREWERTFDAIDDPIALQDGFVIRRANAAYARKVGVPITQVPGRRCHELFAGRSTPCDGCPLLKRGESNDLRGEPEVGGPQTWRFSGYPMTDAPGDDAVVVHYHDITHQKALAERMREGERLAALGQLASGAAHEINNPLGFVSSNLSSLQSTLSGLRPALAGLARAAALLRARKPAEALEAICLAQESVDLTLVDDCAEVIAESLQGTRRIADIVQGLRELSRLEIGTLEPCGVSDSVTRVINALPQGSADVTLSLDARVQVSIPPLQLDRALRHILENACLAVVRGQRIWVSVAAQPASVTISVRDEGCGIERGNLRRIFEPFFSTRGVGKGIGLGLTAAYGIVKRGGGNIEVASELGKGTTFTVHLPRAPDRRASEPSPPNELRA